MRVLVGRGGEPVSLSIGGLTSIDTGWAYDEPAVVADLPITRDELAARGAAMMAQKGWANAADYGADMADDRIEVAGWCEVGTKLEPVFDYDAEEWRWYIIEDDDDMIFDVIPPS